MCLESSALPSTEICFVYENKIVLINIFQNYDTCIQNIIYIYIYIYIYIKIYNIYPYMCFIYGCPYKFRKTSRNTPVKTSRETLADFRRRQSRAAELCGGDSGGGAAAFVRVRSFCRESSALPSAEI